MKVINCTPHPINLNSGAVFEVSETIARVKANFIEAESETGFPVFEQEFSEVVGLPAPEPGTIYIVSAMVLSASDRRDLVAPATGHPDAIRNEKGHIVSVPGFVR